MHFIKLKTKLDNIYMGFWLCDYSYPSVTLAKIQIAKCFSAM